MALQRFTPIRYQSFTAHQPAHSPSRLAAPPEAVSVLARMSTE
jgi:hypothetical protein